MLPRVGIALVGLSGGGGNRTRVLRWLPCSRLRVFPINRFSLVQAQSATRFPASWRSLKPRPANVELRGSIRIPMAGRRSDSAGTF